MYAKLTKALLSIILCISFIPMAGLGSAFAEEGPGENELLGLNTEDTDEETGNPGNGTTTDSGESDDLLLGESQSGSGGEEAEEVIEAESLINPEPESKAIVPLADPTPSYSVEYRSHIQSIGWQTWVKDGKTTGTTGRALRMEAINIRLLGSGLTGSVEYRAHVQSIGWQAWEKDGALSGTTGSSLRIEAVSIRLTYELEANYDIYYRVHSQGIGWLGWAKNGEDAGTVGYGYRMEAIEIRLVAKGGTAPISTGDVFIKKPMAIEASAHVQSIGWQAWVSDGKTAGTTGHSLRVEAVCLKITNPDYTGSVEYRAYIQGIGWQAWKKDGAAVGTTGQSRQLEAIQVRLSGEVATKYYVYYRVHVAYLGWMGWAADAQTAGTIGLSCRVEALQIMLVPKGGAAPGSTVDHYLELIVGGQGNVSGKGWLPEVSGRCIVGTTGQSRQMEAVKLWIASSNFSGSIEYNVYVAGSGWQDAWIKENEIAGVMDSGKRIEAIKIRLTGDLANKFDIYYRAHTAGWGWLGWAKNGADAGTAKVSLRMEAFEIAITVKGGAAPGSTSGAYWESLPIPETHRLMNLKVANYSSPTGWLIAIDTSNCLLGVYYGSKGNWTNKYTWLCSPGTWATPTVKGTFSVGSRGYVFGSGYSCYYWTQIYGDYLIHSVLYYPGTNIIMEGTMGVPGSHGCVRLDIQNAKWIYDNIPSGTTIVSY